MQKKPRNTLENYHEVKRFEEIMNRFAERKRKEFIFVSIFAVFVFTFMSIWFLYLDSKPDGYIPPFEIRYADTGDNDCFLVMCDYEYLLIGLGDEAHEKELNIFTGSNCSKKFEYILLPEKLEADFEYLFFYRDFRTKNIILPWSSSAETPTDYFGEVFRGAGDASFLHFDYSEEYTLGQAKFTLEPSDSGLNVRVTYLGNEFLITENKVEIVKGDVSNKYRIIETDKNPDLVIKIWDSELTVKKEK